MSTWAACTLLRAIRGGSVHTRVGIHSHNLNWRDSLIGAADVNDNIVCVVGANSHL